MLKVISQVRGPFFPCFATIKKAVYSKEDKLGMKIINQNMFFNGGDYQLRIYPFYPALNVKKEKSLSIYKDSSVLAFIFVPKTDQKIEAEGINAWNDRKNFRFKFEEFGQLLQVEPKSGSAEIIEQKYDQSSVAKYKRLHITDNTKAKTIDLVLEEADEGSKSEVKASIKYMDYRIIHHVLKESLFDLSGFKLSFDYRRSNQIMKLKQNLKGELANKAEMDEIFDGHEEDSFKMK